MSDDDQPKRRGRPPKSASGPKVGTLTFRTRADFRERLEQAAAKSGRSVTEEVELRVERSFETDHLIRSLDNLCSVFIDNGDLARQFATDIMASISSAQEYKTPDGRSIGSRDWSKSIATRLSIRGAVKVLLDHYAPKIRPEEFEGASQDDLEDIKRARGLAVLLAEMATGQANHVVDLVMRHDDAIT